MTPEDWLESARTDARRCGLPELHAALDGLARAAALLRAADWNEDASGVSAPGSALPGPAR